jgi:hypothetical protein
MTFIQAFNKLINIDELLYITKAKTKNIYIAVFKSTSTNVSLGSGGVTQTHYDNTIMYLNPDEYAEFCKNLKTHQKNAQKQTKTKV